MFAKRCCSYYQMVSFSSLVGGSLIIKPSAVLIQHYECVDYAVTSESSDCLSKEICWKAANLFELLIILSSLYSLDKAFCRFVKPFNVPYSPFSRSSSSNCNQDLRASTIVLKSRALRIVRMGESFKEGRWHLMLLDSASVDLLKSRLIEFDEWDGR